MGVKINKRKFADIHKEFKKYKEKDKVINTVYNQIKREYLEDKELNIRMERIYLEKKISNYKGETLEGYSNLTITMITVIVTIAIERAFSENINVLWALVGAIITTVIMLKVYIYINKKYIIKEIDEYTYYKICIEVLNEIEFKR